MIQFRRIIVVAVAILATATVLFMYYHFDPATAGWFPRCPSKTITGLDCPGCGSQRAIHSLLNGDLTGALRYNALLLPALLMVLCIGLSNKLRNRYPQFYRAVTGNVAVYSVLAVIVFWTIIRNLPMFKSWLYCQ